MMRRRGHNFHNVIQDCGTSTCDVEEADVLGSRDKLARDIGLRFSAGIELRDVYCGHIAHHLRSLRMCSDDGGSKGGLQLVP